MNRPIIIDRPGLLSVPQRIFGLVFTTAWWLFFFWLWWPLLVTFDSFQFLQPYAFPHIFSAEGFTVLFELIIFCIIAAIVISLILGAWAGYNYARFRNNRRRRPIALSSDKLAEHFRIGAARLVQWQRIKRLRIHHNEKGEVQRVETLGTGPLPPAVTRPIAQKIKAKESQSIRDLINPS